MSLSPHGSCQRRLEMRKLKYHVASTLDGFIAHEDHTIDGFIAEGEHVNDYLESLRCSRLDSLLVSLKKSSQCVRRGRVGWKERLHR